MSFNNDLLKRKNTFVMYESVYNHFLGTQFESAALGLAFTIDASISTRRRSEMFLRDEKASESAHLGPA